MNDSCEFDAAYDLYKADIFRFVFHLTGNRAEAEDLFQETWLRVVRHGRLRPGGQDLKPWLLTIVLNLHRDALRRKRVRRMFMLRQYRGAQPDSSRSDGYAPSSTEPARATEQTWLQRDIDQAIASWGPVNDHFGHPGAKLRSFKYSYPRSSRHRPAK